MAFNAFKDYLRRKHAAFSGDSATYQAEPMISGYFFAAIRIPPEIQAVLEGEFPADVVDNVNGEYILSATVRNLTPPRSPEITPIEKPGLGGTGLSIPGLMTITRSIEVQFEEYYQAPVTRVIKAWVYAIRDPITGLSRLPNVTQSSYKGTMDLVYFDPSGNNVQFALRFYGVWPGNTPFDAFIADVTAADIILPSVTFNYDVVYHSVTIEEDVLEILQEQVNKLQEASGNP